MTRDETKKILMVVQANYPNYHPQDKSVVIDLWQEMLGQYSYESVQTALMSYISETHEFAPNIGQLIDKIYTNEHPDELDPMEAWAMVSRALRNSAYNYESEYNRLPPIVQRAVGSAAQLHNWAVSESEGIETVIQSNFLRSYRAMAEKQREYDKLPMNVKKRIAEIQGHPMLDGAEYLEVKK